MTEREKRIEEMKKIVDEVFRSTTHHSINLIDVTCRILEEAGYRKADDGRKETAKEIYKALLGTEHIKELHQKEHCVWWVSIWRIEDLNRVFKEFGVEVNKND